MNHQIFNLSLHTRFCYVDKFVPVYFVGIEEFRNFVPGADGERVTPLLDTRVLASTHTFCLSANGFGVFGTFLLVFASILVLVFVVDRITFSAKSRLCQQSSLGFNVPELISNVQITGHLIVYSSAGFVGHNIPVPLVRSQ